MDNNTIEYIKINKEDIEELFCKNVYLYLDFTWEDYSMIEIESDEYVNAVSSMLGTYNGRWAHLSTDKNDCNCKYPGLEVIFKQSRMFDYTEYNDGTEYIEWLDPVSLDYATFETNGNTACFIDENDDEYDIEYILDLLDKAVKFSDFSSQVGNAKEFSKCCIENKNNSEAESKEADIVNN